MPFRWEKLGRLLKPDPSLYWMAGFTGAASALQVDDTPLFDVYVTGRDVRNRSLIGRVRIDIRRPLEIREITPHPVFSCGELGAFDENGVSYPYVVRDGDRVLMYYTGWMPTVLTPFQVHVGLAERRGDGTFVRVSRAPILERTDDDYLAMGSVCVLREGTLWRMWYTCFLGWGKGPGEPKHRYVIKYAESADGVRWKRENRICIGLERPGEHSISRPTVLHRGGRYHMWYCVRGDEYRIGYASSDDGVIWERRDELAGITPSAEGWDGRAQAYPFVFRYEDEIYLLYCGNEYGREGLGLARLVESHEKDSVPRSGALSDSSP